MIVNMARSATSYSPGEQLRGHLERLLADVSRSLSEFADHPEESAHFIRTRVKRLQSLSRLVPRGRPWRKSFLPLCRELKDLFAEVRDTTIVRELGEKYIPGNKSLLRTAATPDLSAASDLVAKSERTLGDYQGWYTIKCREVLQRAGKTYSAARNLGKKARRKHASETDFHNWRRLVKRLLYQSEFLNARKVKGRKLAQLGEALGELQDVCMMQDWLTGHGLSIDPVKIPQTKKRLQSKAIRLGRDVFRPKTLELI